MKLLALALESKRAPEVLFHGSGFEHSTLRPGIHYTGEKEMWDETESNEYLYATTDRELAIAMGIVSAISKKWPVTKAVTDDEVVKLTFYKDPPTLEEIRRVRVYLYEIDFSTQDGWVKVNNQHNGADTEWKTSHDVHGRRFRAVDCIFVADWMRDHRIETFALTRF